MRRILILAAAVAACVISATCCFAEGNWSRGGEWCGARSDKRGARLAKKFSAKILNKQMGIPVYEVQIRFGESLGQKLLPISINKQDIHGGKPAAILWTGHYNGHIDGITSDFSRQSDNVQSIMFTSSEGNSGRRKLYAAEGLITWSSPTGRADDKIVVLWDNALRSHIYLGMGFEELMKSVGIEGLTGYEPTENY